MRFIVTIVFLVTLLAGCTTTPMTPVHVLDVGVQIRNDITIIEPVSADRVGWDELMFQIDKSDVILLGEQHDHAVGHAVQLAVVEDVMDNYPNSILALEMLERDEQMLVDDYMDDLISASTFEKLTNSTNWGAEDGWVAWYQPIIDSVKDRGGFVVAANAPRRYVKLARTDGYERINELSIDRRIYIDFPEELSGGRYRQRFWEFASHDEGGSVEELGVEELDPDDPVLPLFRSQQVWDATMAQSIVNANPTKNRKVVLLVGQFHVEYNGGIVQELQHRAPHLQVLVISIQREIPDEEWRGVPAIADFMIVEN